MIYSLQASFGDPHDYLFTMDHTRSTRNHGGIADPMLDAMIDKKERTLDDRERQQQIKQIQQYVADRAYYGTTAVGRSFIGVQAWVKNYQRSNANGAGAEVWPKAWIDRGS